MTIRNVKNNLNLLDINSISQLDSNDIDYWWQLKYQRIQSDQTINYERKQELLVSINNARDELNDIEEVIIKQILNENQKDYNIPDNTNYFRDPKKEFNREAEKNNFKKSKTKIEESWWAAPLVYVIYRLIRAYIENN